MNTNQKRITALTGLACAGALVLSACSDDGGSGDGENYPQGAVRLIAPADPGSGWDLTARAMSADLAKEDIVTTPVPVENRPGAVGTVFFNDMVERQKGKDDIIGVTSMAMNVNTALGQTEYSLAEDVTLIAGIATEHFVVVTAADSEFTDLNAIAEAIQADPGAVPVGAATDDQFPFSLLMDDAGVDAATINYVTYEGGGEQSAALLSGDIEVAIAGYSEMQPLLDGGEVQGVAILSEEPVEGIDIPTAKEQGVDEAITNWRGIYGPPEMPEYAVEFWADAVEELVASDSWKATAEKHRWTTQYLRGEEFQEYVADVQASVDEGMELVGQEG